MPSKERLNRKIMTRTLRAAENCSIFTLMLCAIFWGNCKDGRLFTIGSQGNSVHDVQRPKLIVQLGHLHSILCVAISRNGQYVLTGDGWDHVAILWEARTGRELRRFEGHTEDITSVAFSPDGQYVLTGSYDRTARLWEVSTGRPLKVFQGQSSFVAFSPDGKLIAMGCDYGRSACLHDLSTDKERQRYIGHTDFISSATFSSDGQYVLTGSYDRTARLWNADTGKEMLKFTGHTEGVTAVAFSSDGKYVLSGGEDRTARLWNVNTGIEIRRFGDNLEAITTLGFSSDSKYALTGGVGDIVRLWDTMTGKELRRFVGKSERTFSAVFSPDGNYVLTASNDPIARLWEIRTGEVKRLFEGYSSSVNSVAFSPSGKYILTGNGDGSSYLWNVETGTGNRYFRGHTASVTSVAFSSDGQYVLTGSYDRTARLWNVDTGKEVRKFTGHTEGVAAVAFSPDGKYVLTGSWDSTARLWDSITGKEVRQVDVKSIGALAVRFSHNGEQFLIGTYHNTVLLETRTGRELQRFEGHTDGINSVAFSPNDQYVLTGSMDKTARLWRIEDRRELQKFAVPSGRGITSVAFSSNGRYVISGGRDEVVRVWEADTGKVVTFFKGHSGEVRSVAISPDDQLVLTGSADGTSRLWDINSGNDLCHLLSFGGSTSLIHDKDGRFDTNNLEELKAIHWIFPDNPMRALPVDIFLRDYYEPRLLSRILAREQLNPVRDMTQLNRVQPEIGISSITAQSPDTVTVSVEVADVTDSVLRDGKLIELKSGAYDLRLFRDGQLVGYSTQTVGTDNQEEIKLNANGKATLKFRNINLPRRADLKSVKFTAYAFNVDRVKSATAELNYKVPEGIPQVKGRAYVVSFGVNVNDDPRWNLKYAANDARLVAEALTPRLKQTGEYRDVVAIPLISDNVSKEGWTKQQRDATKTSFRTVLDLLAGRGVSLKAKAAVPNSARIKKVHPEDLVVISFASHGYTDQQGIFYLVPQDIGASSDSGVGGIKDRCISSEELSVWLRDVDAGEMVMIVDACHSAASVEGEGFKPGPMGSRGLGQLAYDKGMRVLAATQAQALAGESSAIEHGLLTYALMREGLELGKADKNVDQKTTFEEWLNYGVERVPTLYEDVLTGKVSATMRAELGKVAGAKGNRAQMLQQPSLFDFARKRIEFLISKGQ